MKLNVKHSIEQLLLLLFIITIQLCSPTLTVKTVTSVLVWIICSNV